MRRILSIPALLGLAILTLAPAVASAELPPLIPREVIFGNPTQFSAELSPDGTKLAYVAPDDDDVLQVWVQTLGQDDAKAVTQDPKRGIRQFLWAPNGNQIIYLQDNDGDENYSVYVTDLGTGFSRNMTAFVGNVRTVPIASDESHPDEVLLGINLRNPAIFDVYNLDLQTGALAMVEENPGNVTAWHADDDLNLRARVVTNPDGQREMQVRDRPTSRWRKFVDWGPQEEMEVVDFTPGAGSIYLLSTLNFNAKRLLSVNLADGKIDVIAHDPEYDVSGVMLHPETKAVQAVRFNRARQEWKVLDETLEPDFEVLRTVDTGDFFRASTTSDDTKWTVAYTKDDGPIPYYLYDRLTKQATFLFNHRPELDDYTLASMRPVEIEARDGLELQSYLTLPAGVEAKGLPMVLLVHGGPWSRDSWGYDSQAQFLANRGYAVLQVNYRGSSGFGKEFLHAADREFAGKMHDDLIDAVNWAVKEGYADPARVAIMGGSYGGYATLVGLTFTPDVFAAGVDLVGPSNLVTLIESFPAYWKPFLAASWYPRVGNPENPEDRKDLEARSPLFKVDQIQAPLLIAQGAKDPRVTQLESDQIVEALRANGKTVEYLLYEDEGHGLARPENRLHFFAHVENFLAQHLGGRAQPLPSETSMEFAPSEELPAGETAAAGN